MGVEVESLLLYVCMFGFVPYPSRDGGAGLSDCATQTGSGEMYEIPTGRSLRRHVFFTVNLADRRQTLLVDEISVLRSAINSVKLNHPFKLDAMVVLPEHLHLLMALPKNDNDFAKRWMLFKSGFSRSLPKREPISRSRAAKGERGIWQRRYWEHFIRNERDFARHVEYIHYNPVKHGHVTIAADWPYSTSRQYIKLGLASTDWARGDIDDGTGFGES